MTRRIDTTAPKTNREARHACTTDRSKPSPSHRSRAPHHATQLRNANASIISEDQTPPAPPKHQRLYVVMLAALVYCLSILPQQTLANEPSATGTAPSSKAATPIQIIPNNKLPAAVVEMRDAILTACHSGRMDDLQTALEWNELTPELRLDTTDATQDTTSDAIKRWTERSAQAKGRDVLAILANLLALPATTLPIGRDLENHDVYVWPHLAEIPPAQLTPGQIVQLYQIMPTAQADAILKSGKWTWYRLAIGADGTWHSFIRSK